MRMMIRKLLKDHRYPREGMDDVVTTVMQQCELWADNMIIPAVVELEMENRSSFREFINSIVDKTLKDYPEEDIIVSLTSILRKDRQLHVSYQY